MIGKWENAEPGIVRKIFPPGKSVMMMEVHFEKGAEGLEHSHSNEQLTYCLQGKFHFTIDGEDQIVTAGETLVIPSNKKHGVIALEKGILIDTFTPIRKDLLGL